MRSQCSICNHPKRHEIEKAVLAGDTLRPTAERFAVSTAAISRHTRNCVARAVQRVQTARKVIQAERDAVSREVLRETVAAETERTLQVCASIEQIVNKIIERVMKLYDACDHYLTDPDKPGEYTLDGQASAIRIIWEELEGWQNGGPKEGEPAVWVKKTGTLQEALGLAFCNGHRKLDRVAPIKYADPRELILKAAAELGRVADLMAKLEGRYRPVEKALGEGATLQLTVVQNILVQNGLLK